MGRFSLFYTLILSLFAIISDTQPLTQGNSPHVESGQKVVPVPTPFLYTNAATYTYNITVNKIQIPTAEWRKPFISLSSVSKFRTYQNRKMQFYC